MFKKIFALATVLIALPALANAWTLGTWAKSQGGSITSPNVVGSQTVINGSVTKSYSTASENVTVAANPGWKISKLEINGIVQTAIPAMPIVASNGGVQKVYATFARQSYVLSSIVGANGTVDKSSYSPVYAGLQSPVKSFVFTPAPGFAVTGISATVGTQDVDYQFLNAVTGLPVTLPAAVGVKVKLNVANVPSTSMAFTANFSGSTPPVVNPPTAETVAQLARTQCANCHATQGVGVGVYAAYSTSVHKNNNVLCYGCHAGANTGGHPGNVQCANCHSAAGPGAQAPHNLALLSPTVCADCHSANQNVHDINVPNTPTSGDNTAASCLACHDTAQGPIAGLVNDNNGVRAIVQEFSKWSHHVTGVTLDSAHCAACHLEGKVFNGKLVVDANYHMADNMTHLRNADDDSDMQWDPAAPIHSTMDTFCMSCHDANGATSTGSQAVQAYINSKGIAAQGKVASSSNPFGDTISNRYDKMLRPAVVDVDSQFATTNNSHHGVKGPRYTGRTRTAGARQIASPGTFANNSSAVLYGVRSTIYDALTVDGREAFNALYVPLEDAGGEAAPRTGALELGDDSTLHCGDCHTVGQWQPGTAKSFTPELPTGENTPFTSPAIGAHGSNNEYLLRNSKGTDERHTQDAYVASAGIITLQNPNAAFLVCFNCHSYSRYGSIFNATGTTGPHAGEYDASGRCNGVGNTIPFNGYTTGSATDGTQFVSRFEGPVSKYAGTPAFAPGFPLNEANRPATGEQNPDFGNIFGIQCLNCHNSGVENGYGGIHGSKINTYVDGMGNIQKMERFLPGLGNTKYVPGTMGGITGGTIGGPVTNTRNTAGPNQVYTYQTGGVSNDANWEQVASKYGPVGAEYAGAGCYTLTEAAGKATSGQEGLSVDGGASIPEAFGTWGGCDDHGAVQGAGDHGVIKRINRPVTY